MSFDDEVTIFETRLARMGRLLPTLAQNASELTLIIVRIAQQYPEEVRTYVGETFTYHGELFDELIEITNLLSGDISRIGAFSDKQRSDEEE